MSVLKSNPRKFSTNLFSNVNGYKEPEALMSFALDRASCLLPPLMKTMAVKCSKFTQWRDIRNLLGTSWEFIGLKKKFPCSLVRAGEIVTTLPSFRQITSSSTSKKWHSTAAGWKLPSSAPSLRQPSSDLSLPPADTHSSRSLSRPVAPTSPKSYASSPTCRQPSTGWRFTPTTKS